MTAFSQQPWTQKKGEAYLQTSVSLFNYKEIYVKPSFIAEPARKIVELVFSQYVEYGLTDKLMLTVNLPLHYLSSGDVISTSALTAQSKGSLFALGNVYGGFTYNFVNKNGFVFSSSLSTYAKTSSYDSLTGLRSGYGAFGIEPMVSAGLGREKHFYTLSTGVNLRTNDYSHQYKVAGQYGTKFGKNKRLWFILGVNAVIPLGEKTNLENTVLDGNATSTYLYLNEQGFVGINLKLGYEKGKWSTWASLGGGPGWKVGRGGVYNLSLGYQINKKKG